MKINQCDICGTTKNLKKIIAQGFYVRDIIVYRCESCDKELYSESETKD